MLAPRRGQDRLLTPLQVSSLCRGKETAGEMLTQNGAQRLTEPPLITSHPAARRHPAHISGARCSEGHCLFLSLEGVQVVLWVFIVPEDFWVLLWMLVIKLQCYLLAQRAAQFAQAAYFQRAGSAPTTQNTQTNSFPVGS